MGAEYSRWVPLGYDTTAERRFQLSALPLSVLWSFIYFDRYQSAQAELYVWMGELKVLKQDAVMPDFYTLLDSVFVGFAVTVAGMLGFAAARYAYHYRGSKAIYLMRRLPDRYDLHRRCLLVPLAGAAVGVVAGFALLVIYYRHYLASTPAEALATDQWLKIWGIGR